MSGVGRLLCSPAPHKAWGLLPTQPRAALIASTAPRLSYPHRLQLSGSMHASRSCLFPESQPSQHGTGPAWRYQQTDRILCFLHRVLGLQLSHSNSSAFSFSLPPSPFYPVLSPFPFLLPVSCSYESSAEILPHTPRLTHFPTVSGSPASLADSMQQKLSCPRRRRQQSPSAM